METKQVLRMTEGDGEFSYTLNSTIPGKVFTDLIKPVLVKAMKTQFSADNFKTCKVITVADLGCGVGQTPIALVSTVIETVHNICQELNVHYDQVPEIQVFMSDLPANDFNLLFKDLQQFQKPENGMPLCFINGAPGSFHDRLFPRQSLNFVHSNYALHWLFQVPSSIYDGLRTPLNKRSFTASENSPSEVIKAFYAQFQQDFTLFLRSRSHEVLPGGHMLFTIPGRPSIEPWQSPLLKCLYQALSALVSKGVILEREVDAFDIPMYYPCKEEIQGFVAEEGSFTIEHMEIAVDDVLSEIKDVRLRAEALTKNTRSFAQALISYHFGEEIWDTLHYEQSQAFLKQLEPEMDRLDVFVLIILLKRQMD